MKYVIFQWNIQRHLLLQERSYGNLICQGASLMVLWLMQASFCREISQYKYRKFTDHFIASMMWIFTSFTWFCLRIKLAIEGDSLNCYDLLLLRLPVVDDRYGCVISNCPSDYCVDYHIYEPFQNEAEFNKSHETHVLVCLH